MTAFFVSIIQTSAVRCLQHNIHDAMAFKATAWPVRPGLDPSLAAALLLLRISLYGAGRGRSELGYDFIRNVYDRIEPDNIFGYFEHDMRVPVPGDSLGYGLDLLPELINKSQPVLL